MERILIIDDEPGIRTVLRGVLESAGYAVDSVESGEAALEHVHRVDYDLLLVDLQLTGIDGLGVIRQAKKDCPDLATVILTGFATIDSAVAALREEVDDYLVKPARPRAIREAVQRALRRQRTDRRRAALLERIVSDVQTLLDDEPPQTPLPEQPPTSRVIDKGPLHLDETTHRARWHDRPLSLTPTEFKLLTCLARNAGKVLSPQEMVASVQGYHCSLQEARELVKPHLYSLRAAIEPHPSRPQFLINVRGVGYSLRLEE